MDVHKQSISIAVMNSAGKIVMESAIETKASMILQFIDGLRGDLQVTQELSHRCGINTFWFVPSMRYIPNLVILFAFSLTIVSEQPVTNKEMSTQSAQVALFEQKLDRRIERFDTSGRTLVASVVDLAFTYQLPTAIEYADRDATTRVLNLQFHNESVRGILKTTIRQFPEYGISFSGGIVDVFAPKAREDSSNLLNTAIRDFAVMQVDTHEADFQLFCAVSREVGLQACGGSIAGGQWKPLKNGNAIWTVMVRPEKLSKLRDGGIWYVYPLQQPFKAVVSETLASLKP
jgi:hypothetical protein